MGCLYSVDVAPMSDEEWDNIREQFALSLIHVKEPTVKKNNFMGKSEPVDIPIR